MKKAEALKMMAEGIKITHRYFSPGEWMTNEGNKIRLEDGVICSQNEFWRWRMTKDWDDGYEIYSK
jgi:hypothetical protein